MRFTRTYAGDVTLVETNYARSGNDDPERVDYVRCKVPGLQDIAVTYCEVLYYVIPHIVDAFRVDEPPAHSVATGGQRATSGCHLPRRCEDVTIRVRAEALTGDAVEDVTCVSEDVTIRVRADALTGDA
eukprot:3748836-Pyramimonas_sp.AAC.1